MKKNITITILSTIIVILGITVFVLISDKKEVTVASKVAADSNKQQVQNIIEDEELAINHQKVTTESDLTNYLSDIGDEVENITAKKEITSQDERKLKNTFITLTDFIFYDGEIKGKKFSDLTNDTKEKILDVYNKIDTKIEARFPNYQEKIKSTSKKVYTNIREKTVDLKNKIKDEYRQQVGEEGYQSVVDNYEDGKNNAKDVYDTYKPYIEEGKTKAKSAIDKAKEKASSWYQKYKES